MPHPLPHWTDIDSRQSHSTLTVRAGAAAPRANPDTPPSADSISCRRPREEIERIAGVLHDTLKLRRVAPGHCTSEPGFAVFMRKFGDRFDPAGLGAALQLPR